MPTQQRPPSGAELVRTAVGAVVAVVVVVLLLVLTPVLELVDAAVLLSAYVIVVGLVTLARWLQSRSRRG